MDVLVTGGAGFIGSNLVELHLNKGDTVYAVDNLSSGSLDNISTFKDHKNFHFVASDLLTWKELPEVLAKVDRVYHLAAVLGMFLVLEHPVLTIESNVKTTERLLEILSTMKKRPVLMIASSSEVYGNQTGLLGEDRALVLESTTKNHANYPISKLCNESMGLAFFHELGVPTIIVRLFNTIGKRQSERYGMVVPRFVKQACENQPITIFDDGSQKRSFCDVRDTVNILYSLAGNPRAIGEVINVGNDEFITIKELAEKIKKIANSHSELTYAPYSEVYHGGYIDIHERHIDTTKMQSYVHYEYQWPLAETIAYLVRHHKHV